VRYLNAGSVTTPPPHGNDQRVITEDGQPVLGVNGTDASYDKFLIDIGPGQSADTLDQWSTRALEPQTNPIPSPAQLQIRSRPGTETWFSENPYLGGNPGEVPAAWCEQPAVSTTWWRTATPPTGYQLRGASAG